MGYFAEYEFIAEVIKSPPRLRDAFRKHACAVTYIPSMDSCSVERLAEDYGRALHESSGDRIGFALVRKSKSEVHKGSHYHPSVDTLTRRWTDYFDPGQVTTRVVDPRIEPIGPVAQSVRTIARHLGIAGRTPCLLVFWLPAGGRVYCLPLQGRSTRDVAASFDRFACAFYDANARIIADLCQIEALLQEAVLDPLEAESTIESLEALSADLAIAERRGEVDTRLLERLAAVAAAPSSAKALGDERVLDLLPVEFLLNLPDVRSALGRVVAAEAVQRCMRVIGDSLRLGSVPDGRAFNTILELARNKDAGLLNALADFELTVRFDFSRYLELWQGGPQVARRVKRLRDYVERKCWWDQDHLTLRFVPGDLGALFSLARIMAVPHDPSFANSTLKDQVSAAMTPLIQQLERIASAYDTFVAGELSRLSSAFTAVASEVVKALREQCRTRISLDDGRELLARTSCPSGGPLAISHLVEAHTRITQRMSLPSEYQPLLLDITDSTAAQDTDIAHAGKILSGSWNLTERVLETSHSGSQCGGGFAFLSYAHADRKYAAQIVELLHKRGIRLWFDETDVNAGQLFQRAMELGISKASAAIVLIGARGLAGYQSLEVRAVIAAHVERQIPVLPVLLPGIASLPESPLLGQFSMSRFITSLEETAVLDRIVEGLVSLVS